MPYKFKDDGSDLISPLKRKLYMIISGLLIIRPIISLLLFHYIDLADAYWFSIGLFLVWAIQFNGFYKIARRYAEWNLKRKGNKFDYYSK